MLDFTFETNKPLPADVFSRGSSESKYSKIYSKILSLPIVGKDVDKWAVIGNLPNKQTLTRLQACINPSTSKQGSGKNPRAYQAGLIEQGAKVVSRRQEHKDGTYSLYIKKVSRDEN
jgi:hypothetical protein